MMRAKRVYEAPDSQDGTRVLVDRLWPRGLSKASARIDIWMREISPSDELRRRYHHDAGRWEEFRASYWKELDSNGEATARLRAMAEEGTVTLLYSARDTERNNAVALMEYLQRS